jgi:hypothetical protein
MGYALRIARSYAKPEERPRFHVVQGRAEAQSESEAGSPEKAEEPKQGYIYSRLLNMNIYPVRDPETGRITKVETEAGDVWTEQDINALRAIRDTFGIEEMVKVIREERDKTA